MKIPDLISFPNRYPNICTFAIPEEKEKKLYKLYIENAHYVNASIKDDDENKFNYIDPDGGPLIAVGSKWANMSIKTIYWDPSCKHYFIEFE